MKQLFPILYSLTSKGQTQTWRIETDGARFRTHEGLLDGAITTSSWTECFVKNAGRANEVSALEQAGKEAESRHQKKIDNGYCQDVGQIAMPKFFKPMLAKKWEDYADEVVWPVYSQPKLDGLRCIVSILGMFSRNGKPIASAPHILESLKPLFAAQPDLVLDGELYSHDLKADFNKIISLAKKVDPTPEELAESAASLEYWVYDMQDDSYGNPLTFRQRLAHFGAIRGYPSAHAVETLVVSSQDELDALYSEYLAQGFEGQMIRTLDGEYEHKRSKNLLKRKNFTDDEFELVDLEPGRGNAANHAARAILKTADGVVFEAGIIGSHEYCAQILRDKDQLIGKMATVVYQNLTPGDKPVPRFGKLKTIIC